MDDVDGADEYHRSPKKCRQGCDNTPGGGINTWQIGVNAWAILHQKTLKASLG